MCDRTYDNIWAKTFFYWFTILRYWFLRRMHSGLYSMCIIYHTYLKLFCVSWTEQVVLTLWLMSVCLRSAAMGVPVVLQHFPLWDRVRRLLGSVFAGCHRHSRGHAAGWWGHPNPYVPMFSKIRPLIYRRSIQSSAECQGQQQLANVMMMSMSMMMIMMIMMLLCFRPWSGFTKRWWVLHNQYYHYLIHF